MRLQERSVFIIVLFVALTQLVHYNYNIKLHVQFYAHLSHLAALGAVQFADSDHHLVHAGLGVSALAFASVLGYGVLGPEIRYRASTRRCTVHTALTGPDGRTTWDAYATGDKCDVEAEVAVISREFARHLAAVPRDVCRVACVTKWTDGRLHGFVSVVPAGEKSNDFYCGRMDESGPCKGNLPGGSAG